MGLSTHFCAELPLQCIENGLDGLLRVVIGEGLIVGAHGEREGDGLLVLSHVAAGVYIEQAAALEILAAAAFNAFNELGNGNSAVTYNGDVTGNSGEAGQSSWTGSAPRESMIASRESSAQYSSASTP